MSKIKNTPPVRRISSEGLAFIKQWEGLRLEAYRCTAGVWTIGYGHTLGVTEGARISQEDAEKLLLIDLSIAESAVSRAVSAELTDNQFAALVSWTYNVGVGAMRKSTLVRKLNAGDVGAVPGELARWNKTGGNKVDAGLSNRRAAEAGLWARGSFVSSRSVEAATPAQASTAMDASKLGGVAAAAATAAPALTGLSGLHWAVGVALVAGAVLIAGIWLFKKRDT
jgi:lysozyme